MQEFVPGSNIFAIDALYYEPQIASIHLLREGDRIAIIDTGTQFSAPQVTAALHKLGLNHQHVDLIILTHIHLDHAGGAGTLMQQCPNAQLVVHKKGARHMAHPEKLIAGATAVYGEQGFQNLYGEVTPIDEQRMLQPEDEAILDFAGRPLQFIDSPGHASHHHCIIDQQSNSIFTGDTLGVGYRALRNDEHAFVAATTTPVQFNPVALHKSIDRVMSYEPEHLYLTHYSHVTPSARIVAGLHEQIDDFVALTEQAAEAGDAFEAQLASLLHDYLVRRCLNELPGLDPETAKHWLKLDADLNAQGLAFWWQYRRAA
ncbi:MAG: MBL fold metallo-hydrolase [Gammaproteobacteria bacterium]|nr:MBL fold metallo-hydrolase [Gammaproteobacteria bacterium]